MDKKDLSTTAQQDPVLEEDDLFMSPDDLENQVKETQSNQARFIVAFDATGSMGAYWSEAKQALGRVVEEISQRCGGNVAVQMVAYRDDNDDPYIVEHSVFTNSEATLKAFITKQRCFGGDDYPEAVDTCLEHVIKELPSRTVLLGDAPAHYNMQGRDGYTQASKLGNNNSPVFTLRLTDEKRLEENFKEIAKLSGGKSFLLKNVSDMVDIIATIIAADKKLLRTVSGALPYYPKSEAAKEIAKELK